MSFSKLWRFLTRKCQNQLKMTNLWSKHAERIRIVSPHASAGEGRLYKKPRHTVDDQNIGKAGSFSSSHFTQYEPGASNSKFKKNEIENDCWILSVRKPPSKQPSDSTFLSSAKQDDFLTSMNTECLWLGPIFRPIEVGIGIAIVIGLHIMWTRL